MRPRWTFSPELAPTPVGGVREERYEVPLPVTLSLLYAASAFEWCALALYAALSRRTPLAQRSSGLVAASALTAWFGASLLLLRAVEREHFSPAFHVTLLNVLALSLLTYVVRAFRLRAKWSRHTAQADEVRDVEEHVRRNTLDLKRARRRRWLTCWSARMHVSVVAAGALAHTGASLAMALVDETGVRIALWCLGGFYAILVAISLVILHPIHDIYGMAAELRTVFVSALVSASAVYVVAEVSALEPYAPVVEVCVLSSLLFITLSSTLVVPSVRALTRERSLDAMKRGARSAVRRATRRMRGSSSESDVENDHLEDPFTLLGVETRQDPPHELSPQFAYTQLREHPVYKSAFERYMLDALSLDALRFTDATELASTMVRYQRNSSLMLIFVRFVLSESECPSYMRTHDYEEIMFQAREEELDVDLISDAGTFARHYMRDHLMPRFFASAHYTELLK